MRKTLICLVIGMFIAIMLLPSITAITKIQNSNENSLGTVILEHQPLLKAFFRVKGLDSYYEPPADNPTYKYYFPEDEYGCVHLNFTLNVKHSLKPLNKYWASLLWPENHRYTGIIAGLNWADCYTENITVCNSSSTQEYTIYLSDDTPFVTNGNTLNFTFWIFAYPAITPISRIQKMCAKTGPLSVLDLVVPYTNISIIPY